MKDQNALKQDAAKQAVSYITDGMLLGLGTGSTMQFALDEIGRLIAEKQLSGIVGVPTSEATADRARQLGIPLTNLDDQPELAINIDGADEIDPHLNLIKGLGGALLREKIVASAARAFIVVADSSKLVPQLGSKAPVPIEVIPMARSRVERLLIAMGGRTTLRLQHDGTTFITDEGNLILDYYTGPIADPAQLADILDSMTGVVEHGLFLGMATRAVVATPDGVQEIERP